MSMKTTEMYITESYVNLVCPAQIFADTPARNLGGRKTASEEETRALSPQEYKIARLVALGLTDKQIAYQLEITPRTVAHYLQSVFRKRGVNSRVLLATVMLNEPEPDFI